MELAIQKFLRSFDDPSEALEKAVEKFGLKINENGSRVQFNYDITATRCQEADECRGLILDRPKWDIVSFPFYRFYNQGEGRAAEVGSDQCVLFDKLDGSLMTVYWYDGCARVATRGRVEADGGVNSLEADKTFADLFWQTFKEVASPEFQNIEDWPEYLVAVFELTSPENRVVTPYANRGLHLLTARVSSDWEELDLNDLVELSEALGIPTPKVFEFNSIEDIAEMLSMRGTLEEGYVLTDYGRKVNGSFSRIKIKNPSYLAAHHLVGNNFNEKRALELVMIGEHEEFCSYFPEYKLMFDRLRSGLDELATELDREFSEMHSKVEHINDEREKRKEFATMAIKSIVPSVMFRMLDGKLKTARDGVVQMKSEMLLEILNRRR